MPRSICRNILPPSHYDWVVRQHRQRVPHLSRRARYLRTTSPSESTIFTLVYLYLRHRPTYVVIRNVFFISAAIGLLCYAFYPTAPPRLMPGYGFTDTIATAARNAPDVRPGAFENAYAAVPSLHCGWALMIALAFWWTARHWIVRVLAVIEAVGMIAAVVFTANHYFIDAALGIAVVLIALWFASMLQAREGRRCRDRAETHGSATDHAEINRSITPTSMRDIAGRGY